MTASFYGPLSTYVQDDRVLCVDTRTGSVPCVRIRSRDKVDPDDGGPDEAIEKGSEYEKPYIESRMRMTPGRTGRMDILTSHPASMESRCLCGRWPRDGPRHPRSV